MTEIPTIDATSAAEFWEYLSPQKPFFNTPGFTVLYRGQADARWPLTPSIIREPEIKVGHRALSIPDSERQIFKEWLYLIWFADYCGSIGRAIPNDSPEFRELFLNLNSPAGPGGTFKATGLWPVPELYSLMALGQHHGLPTRLLDWSTRSYVAAYFAIADAIRSIAFDPKPATHLAVWVFDFDRARTSDPQHRLEKIQVPGSNNANLAAQAGCFTLLRQDGTRGQPFSGPGAVDEYILGREWHNAEPLKKITLPYSEAKRALELCEMYGVSGATLFPDYYGAARAAQDAMRAAL